MPGPQAFPQEGAYFTVPGRTSADLTAWHRKARRIFLRRLGGYTGDCLGATQQLAEVAVYFGILAAWSFT